MKGEIDSVVHFSFTTDVGLPMLENSCVSHPATGRDSHWCPLSRETRRHAGESNEQVHLVLQDNEANMIKVMRDASLVDIGCFAHTFQLVVHNGILSQHIVNGMLAVCCKIVGNFKLSSAAYHCLKEIQENLGLSQHHPNKTSQPGGIHHST